MTVFTAADACKLEQQIKQAEGFHPAAYRRSSGALTVGFGHNCNATPVHGVSRAGDRVTREEAERLFALDLSDALWRVRKALPWVTKLSPPRQAVLYEMAYSMGLGLSGASGLLSLRGTLKFIQSGNYPAAARSMLASTWAAQTCERAKKLARQMDTGEWQLI
ncbi:MAG: hypothetical protein FWG04_03635 [Desulfovibrionaceae bacterium]|nr:hypothetical protein [Desulfovibrionaceae bacterium]